MIAVGAVGSGVVVAELAVLKCCSLHRVAVVVIEATGCRVGACGCRL